MVEFTQVFLLITPMKYYPLVLATVFLSFVGAEAKAQKLLLPSKISCNYGSVVLRQVGPTETYNNTKAAAFMLKVNGVTENATGIESGNFTKVSSQNYYVFGGTGGLAFGKKRASKNKVICTNSKYGQASPGFSYQ